MIPVSSIAMLPGWPRSPSAAAASAVPQNSGMNRERRMSRLVAFMAAIPAAIPAAGGRLPGARITKAGKGKNRPQQAPADGGEPGPYFHEHVHSDLRAVARLRAVHSGGCRRPTSGGEPAAPIAP